jgi:hypothetical protein
MKRLEIDIKNLEDGRRVFAIKMDEKTGIDERVNYLSGMKKHMANKNIFVEDKYEED